MLRKIHPKIIGLLLLSVCILIFFLYTTYRNNKDSAESINLLNQIEGVTGEIEQLNSLILAENLAYRKSIKSGPSAVENVKFLRQQLVDSIQIIEHELPPGNAIQGQLRELEGLLGRSFAIQDAGEDINAAEDALLIEDSIHMLTASMIRSQQDALFKRRQQLAHDIRSDISQMVIGGIVVFIFVLIILTRFNKDNQRLKIAKNQADENEAKYRSLIENAGQVMYTADLDGYITFASSKAVNLTGYLHEELIGRNIATLIDPGMVEEVLNTYINQVKNRIPETVLQLRIVTKQGDLKAVGQSATLVMSGEQVTGFQCTVWDINEMAQIQRDLRESEENLRKNSYQLQSILDNTNALIYIKDIHGRYQIVNKRFVELIGVPEERVINHTDYSFTPREKADHYRELDDRVIATRQPNESEEEIDSPNGKTNLLLGKFPLLDENGEVFGICGIATDITDRTNYQRELIEARSTAESARQLQEQFLANMSHEIRTPMNGIQGMTNLLYETSLDEQQLEFVSYIKRCVNNLLVVINDILDFSKIQAGKLNIEEIPFDPAKIIDNLKMDFSHRLKEKELELEMYVDPAIPKVLVGDPYRLTQVLINFVGNAIKFTEKGKITLRASLKAKKSDEAWLEFMIADTGIGIAKEDLGSIFESFNQGHKSTTRLYGGTGLGLAICKQLVEMQHGTVSVTSKLGEGSCFYVNIPYRYSDNELAGEQPVINKTDHQLLLSGKKILVVEDNEVNQKLLVHVLKKIGIEPDLANNGQEAINWLYKREYDLIIMDIQMPVMGGYDATTFIRNNMHLDTPILAMTATALKGEVAKCLEVGMNDYMSKPFRFEDLYEKIFKLTTTGYEAPLIKTEEMQEDNQMYSLSFLEEMGSKKYTVDMIDLVLATTREQLNLIKEGIAKQDWAQVTHNAHKSKSSIGMLHVHTLLGLMTNIEHFSKDESKRDQVAQLYSDVQVIFDEFATRLGKDRDRLQQELAQEGQ